MREARIAWIDPEELSRLQARRLGRLLVHAWNNVPYYRDWMRAGGAEPGDIRCADDLARLPLIDKEEFARHSQRFSAPRHAQGDGITLSSSGTSGSERLLRYDARAVLEALAAGRRQRLALSDFTGRETGYREAVFHREGSVGTQIRAFLEGRTLIPSRLDLQRGLFSPALPFEALLAGVNEFRPEVIRGYGSHLGAFFRWLRDGGRRFQKPRALVYGADSMPAADRRLVEEDLGIPVLSTYQAVEALRIGFECQARAGFHLSADQVAVRAVDSSGRDVRPGERGELVLTNLTNYATPIINYRLGDMVTLGPRACPCGRALPLVTSIDGRADDLVARPGGTWIHALTLLAPLQSTPSVVRVQLVQEEVDEFLIKVVWSAGSRGDPQELMRRMHSVLGASARIRVEPLEQIPSSPSGKTKSLISLTPRP